MLPKSFELDLNRIQLAKLPPTPFVWDSHKFCRRTDLIQGNERAAGGKIDYRVADNIINVSCHDTPDVFANRLFLLI